MIPKIYLVFDKNINSVSTMGEDTASVHLTSYKWSNQTFTAVVKMKISKK